MAERSPLNGLVKVRILPAANAGVAQWQSSSFVNYLWGFDSSHQLQFMYPGYIGDEKEVRLLRILAHSPAKVIASMETVIVEIAPSDFVFKVKGRDAFYQIYSDAQKILKEEMDKGMDNLYERLQKRVDSYWNEPLE